VGGHVALAIGAIVDDLAVAGENGYDAGNLPLVDGLLHEGVEMLEALRGEADSFRPHNSRVGRRVGRLLRGRWYNAQR
jgi:hypothetical protein